MSKLNYVFSIMAASRASTAVKILSMALGLTMCSFLFARIVHDNSIDTCFKDPKTLYQIWNQYTIDGRQLDPGIMCYFPLARTCAEEIPEMVEYSTVLRPWGIESIEYESFETEGNMLIADTMFFKTMGEDIIAGEMNPQATPRTIYISNEFAQEVFKGKNPVGEIVKLRDVQLTIKGVFKSWGEETTIPADIIGWISDWWPASDRWNGGDSWWSYLRLKDKPGNKLNDKIQAVFDKHSPSRESVSIKVWAQPITDTFSKSERVRHTTLTLSILGIAILFVTALNYVLLSISSLSKRAKSIGVHKCSGAKNSTIFSMFALETFIIILGALILGLFFWWLAKKFAEETVFNNFAAYISLDRLWIVMAVVVLIFAIAGIIPGKIFSNVPVGQVFRRYSEKKHGWKHALLFIEFAGTALVVGLLVVVFAQYKLLMTADSGYNDNNLVLVLNDGQESLEHTNANIAALKSLPYIEGVTCSSSSPSMGYSGEFIRNYSGKELFSSRYDYVSSDYPDIMGMEFIAGEMAPSDSISVIVNEKFAELIGLSPENAIGQRFKFGSNDMVITGVLKNFKIGNYYSEMMPYVAFTYDYSIASLFSVQVAEPFDKNFAQLSDTLPKMMSSGERLYFEPIRKIKTRSYRDVNEFRLLVSIAAVILLIICSIGMTGYMNDEMSRRSREIAVRKVNGATTTSVVRLICRSVLITALPAVTLGIVAAWYFSHMWLEQFTITLQNLTITFILSGLATIIIILCISIVLTVRRASANPVENLRSE